MKRIIKEKAVEIILGLLLSSAILFTGFYYNTQNDIEYLKSDNVKIHEKQDTLECRMNEKDVQYKEIAVKLDYISAMLEEIRGK